jgi:prepilin-type N-terminal cleavage/methylation domain-containing protein
MDKQRGFRGFSLIELLVVICIITILMGILLPTLNTTREFARGFYCSNSLRQLMMATMMYSSDNSETWPGRGDNSATDFDNTLKAWVPCGDANDSRFDVKKGSLFPYVKNSSMYKCISDPKAANGQLSYSMNANLYVSFCTVPGPSATITYPKPGKFTQQPDKLVIFVDEGEPNDGNFKPIEPSNPFADRPQWYHNDRTGFCFFDAHTELRREDDKVIGDYLNPCWFPVEDQFVSVE